MNFLIYFPATIFLSLFVGIVVFTSFGFPLNPTGFLYLYFFPAIFNAIILFYLLYFLRKFLRKSYFYFRSRRNSYPAPEIPTPEEISLASKIPTPDKNNFIDVLNTSINFFMSQDVKLFPSIDVKKGAGTLNYLFFPLLFDKHSYKYMSIERCSRPNDGLYIEEGCRTETHTQLQIYIIEDEKNENLNIFFDLLKTLNINLDYVALQIDDWSHFVLSAEGKGYEASFSGLEFAQVTIFETLGGIKLSKRVLEIAIGIERLSMIVQQVTDIKYLNFDKFNKYKNILLNTERENTQKTILFNSQNTDLFNMHKERLEQLIQNQLYHSAIEELLSCSQILNESIDLFDEEIKREILIYLRKTAEICLNKIYNKEI